MTCGPRTSVGQALQEAAGAYLVGLFECMGLRMRVFVCVCVFHPTERRLAADDHCSSLIVWLTQEETQSEVQTDIPWWFASPVQNETLKPENAQAKALVPQSFQFQPRGSLRD